MRTLVFIQFHDLSTESPQHTSANLQLHSIRASQSAWTSCDQRFSNADDENKQHIHVQKVKNIKAPAVWVPAIRISCFDLKPLV